MDHPAKFDAATAAIHRELDAKTSAQFVKMPLTEVALFLSQQHGIPVQLDRKALRDAGIDSDPPVTAKLTNVSLRSLLTLALHELDCTFVVQDEVLLITTKDEANQRVETVVYDVLDLLKTGDADVPDSHLDYDSLSELIVSTIAPTTWEIFGPSITHLDGMFVIPQTQEAHHQIAQLLADLRKVRAARPERASAEASEDPQKVTLRVYKVGVPLLPIAGAAKPAPPAAPATEKMPASLGCGSVKRARRGSDGGSVTSQPADNIPRAPDPRYLETLADTIRSTIEPQSWDKSGGEGVIQALPADENGLGTLVVKQNGAAHAQIDRLLKHLREPSLDKGGQVIF